MALLSSGKCGGGASGTNGGGSPPPALPSVRTLGGPGNALLPPAMYCPMLPPWHLALLTHHALHARGLGMGGGSAGPYLPLPPVFTSAGALSHPAHGGSVLSRAQPFLQTLSQSQETAIGIRDRDSTTSPTTVGVTSPIVPPRPHQPRIRSSFTIADLLGNSDGGANQDGTPSTGSEDGGPQGYDDQLEGVMDETPDVSPNHDPGARFQWLQCTRYHPPKLPRVKRREGGQKRKLGRNPRVPFSSTQLAALEARFTQSQYLSSCDVADLSALLNLTETRVKIWFQNRRARERRDREARAKGLLPPSSTSSSITHSSSVPSTASSSSSSSSLSGGPLPPSALALYQFTAALAPGSASAFSPVLPRPSFDAPPSQLSDSTCDPPSRLLDMVVAPPTLRDVTGLLSVSDASRDASPPVLNKVNNIIGSSPRDTSSSMASSPLGRDLISARLTNECELGRISSPHKKNNLGHSGSPDSP